MFWYRNGAALATCPFPTGITPFLVLTPLRIARVSM